MDQLGNLLCTICLNYSMYFGLCMILCIYLLWIFISKMKIVNGPKYITTYNYCYLLISKMFIGWKITNQQAYLLLKWGNMNNLGKILCKYCPNYKINFAFCIIICIYLLYMYYLKMESVNWPKYPTTFLSFDLLISKYTSFSHITHW